MRVHQVSIQRFESKNLSPKTETKPQALKTRPADISREQLSSLAADLRGGGIDQQEATSRFIDLATGGLKDQLGDKAYRALIRDLTEVLVEDPQFTKDLTKNLSLIR